MSFSYLKALCPIGTLMPGKKLLPGPYSTFQGNPTHAGTHRLLWQTNGSAGWPHMQALSELAH